VSPAEVQPPELVAALTRERGEPLVAALEEAIPGSRTHADATASWALAVAVERGLERDRCLAIREAARLHDIGRVYVEEDLAARPFDELSEEEARRVEAHADAGSRLAEGAGVPPAACAWLRHSRERFDGRGVPEGLFGGAIPVESRIIRTACAFDAALDRATREVGEGADPQSGAIETVRARAGSELDPQAVEALVRVLSRAADR
jgi:HD-GYP domain-containing protein (c-di-GMP phosphodiesterase class II)